MCSDPFTRIESPSLIHIYIFLVCYSYLFSFSSLPVIRKDHHKIVISGSGTKRASGGGVALWSSREKWLSVSSRRFVSSFTTGLPSPLPPPPPSPPSASIFGGAKDVHQGKTREVSLSCCCDDFVVIKLLKLFCCW